MKYDLIVYIGRFQPLHNNHFDVIRSCTDLTDHLLIVIGSCDQPRTIKNPFTKEERRKLIMDTIPKPWVDHKFSDTFFVDTAFVNDIMYNDQAWIVKVQTKVKEFIESKPIYKNKPNLKVGVICNQNDDSVGYGAMFPAWEQISHETKHLSASDIRDFYIGGHLSENYFKSVVPETVFKFLQNFKKTRAYQILKQEYDHIQEYKRQFSVLQYAPTFVTGDAVVVCGGHILLVKRKACPGKGLWALPGGFLNAKTDKSLVECALRELKEETAIDIPMKVLKGSIVKEQIFDAIGRSLRGRTITMAVLIVLSDRNVKLPKVKGTDDAEVAKWVPLSEVRVETLFEDHGEIISAMVGVDLT